MKSTQRILITVGLILGGALGMAGSVVAQSNVRAGLWGVDAVGVILATTLLAIRFFREGNDWLAAGFLIYTIGEAVMLTGTAESLAASVPAFAAGTALWSLGLLLTSVPRGLILVPRVTGVVAAVLFAITAAKIFWGVPLTPISAPLPQFGYPFLVVTFVGWIWHTVKR